MQVHKNANTLHIVMLLCYCDTATGSHFMSEDFTDLDSGNYGSCGKKWRTILINTV